MRSDEKDSERLQNFERDLFSGSKEQREVFKEFIVGRVDTGPNFIHFHPHDDWRPKKKEE